MRHVHGIGAVAFDTQGQRLEARMQQEGVLWREDRAEASPGVLDGLHVFRRAMQHDIRAQREGTEKAGSQPGIVHNDLGAGLTPHTEQPLSSQARIPQQD